MHPPNELHHDEINLFRLVRRLEKSILLEPEDWISSTLPTATGSKAEAEKDEDERKWGDVRAKTHKELQKVKYARGLVRKVGGEHQGSRYVLGLAYFTQGRKSTNDDGVVWDSERTRRLNEVKIALDKIEAVLKDTETKATSLIPPPRLPSLLSQLPPPVDASASSSSTSSSFVTPVDEHAHDDERQLPPLTPEEIPGLPSSGLVSAIPALMSAVEPSPSYDSPSYPLPASTSTSATHTTALSEKPSLTSRTTHGKGMEAHTSLQSELSSQLEAMAAQLKRNALHFSEALEKDKAVVEAALGKVEGNLGFMETQRKRLRDFSGKSGGTTWLTLGIVLCVLLLFVVMVGFIRLTRVHVLELLHGVRTMAFTCSNAALRRVPGLGATTTIYGIQGRRVFVVHGKPKAKAKDE
ncbi:hypothetical protein NMY22_g18472 [Coprinellus aureogranulatus]|nr:hypothetical protein NMY22_g18472 [Coprinellus aureogranulatus]